MKSQLLLCVVATLLQCSQVHDLHLSLHRFWVLHPPLKAECVNKRRSEVGDWLRNRPWPKNKNKKGGEKRSFQEVAENTGVTTEGRKGSKTSLEDAASFEISSSSWRAAGTRRGGKEGGGAGGSRHQQGSEWVSAGWAEHGGRAEQQDRVLLLGLGQDTQRSQTPRITRQTCQSVDMFDNSHYPFNCFNYDGDGYPSSSTDEEKKMCRPAYRYGGLLINLFLFPHFLCISHYTHNHTHKKTYFTFRSSSVFQWDFLSLFTM